MCNVTACKVATKWGLSFLLGWIMLLSVVAARDVSAQMAPNYQELFEHSQKEKKGLVFYVRGQTIAGIVIRLIGNEGVEVRNQSYSRILIRLDSIDAVAMQ
jgi:hypothetical protein